MSLRDVTKVYAFFLRRMIHILKDLVCKKTTVGRKNLMDNILTLVTTMLSTT